MNEDIEIHGDQFKKRVLLLIGDKKPHAWGQEHGIRRWVIERILEEKVPDPKHLVRLSRALGVTVDHLLTGEQPKLVREQSLPYGEGLSDEDREYVNKLLRILREKEEHTKRAIKNNIDEFLEVPVKKTNPLSSSRGGSQEIKKS